MADHHGLALEVMPSGAKYWRYRYRIGGKENIFAAGEWCRAPDGETPEQAEKRRAGGSLTLEEARIERVGWRELVKKGSHPVKAKRAEKLAAATSNANTFDAVAAEYVEKRRDEWGDSHRENVERFLETDVSPDIGALPIREISSAQVLAVLRKVEKRDALSVVTSGRSFIAQVFRYGIATGRVDNDPTISLRNAFKTRATKHHAPLGKGDIPKFFEAMGEARALRKTEIALRLMAYLFCRTIELRSAPWPEFDLDEAEWRIPAARMKMKRPHVIPLPSQAVDLLRELHTLTGHQKWLFPNERRPKACMSAPAINRVIERMGFRDRFTAHGFRATASTMLHEAGFDTRLIELQLAHKDRNKSRAAYDHSARLPERREMMQWWANTLDALAQPKSNVTMFKAQTAQAGGASS